MASILLIDDNEIVRNTLSRILTHDGHSVVDAANGRVALRLLEHEPFDLIITDIVMPEVDGLEFVIQLRRTGAAIPVIVISGGGHSAATPYFELAKQFGAAAVLTKPIDLGELRRLIAELSERRDGA